MVITERCKKYACQIQACLSKNGADQTKCRWEVERLIQCCKKIDMQSVHCSNFFWLV